MTITNRSYGFKRALTREPSNSVVSGLRTSEGPGPDPNLFKNEHHTYVESLEAHGLDVTVLPPLEAFPDSVFVEDVAICMSSAAVLLRPGASSRRGEVDAIKPTLVDIFDDLITLPGDGHVDGGDVLLTEKDAFVGLSERTDQAGFKALSSVLSEFGYVPKCVETPLDVLHFKTDCGLLDANTIFATRRLARTGCFDAYQVILAPDGEESAANLIRVNDIVLVSDGYPRTKTVLMNAGYQVKTLPTSQAGLIDGGLSCMSLRF